ncbi:MAG: hypothetical protein R3298_09445 [Gammaproteobacteria bacterium]|nr:hypothetical protein [Gammaproteobacteria bacterium]
MLVQVPVYNNHFGYHQINIYEQTESGDFRRTPGRMMPHMLVNFDSVSESLGEVVAPAYDRREQHWNTPTVYFYLGRPRSFFRFLREHALQRQIMVLCTQSLSPKVYKFTIHELRFKPNVATAVKALTARKFIEAIDVYLDPEHANEDVVEGSAA